MFLGVLTPFEVITSCHFTLTARESLNIVAMEDAPLAASDGTYYQSFGLW